NDELFVKILGNETFTLYLVEHILLHPAPTAEQARTLSVVLPCWSEKFYSRRTVEQLLVERLPAHVSVRFLWLHAEQLYRFEKLYFPWRMALAAGSAARAEALAQLLNEELTRVIASEV
ncbi:MAG: hypothetical protein LBU92_05760, partial [Prevotellaceae bacterium]|nr:hypothetical protein [Prevotellaceae bacterium]